MTTKESAQALIGQAEQTTTAIQEACPQGGRSPAVRPGNRFRGGERARGVHGVAAARDRPARGAEGDRRGPRETARRSLAQGLGLP